MSNIIEVSGLKKSYGDVHAVRGIDFFVKKGQLFAFLGPNGAGKSTTVEMLCTLLKPNSGEIVIDGYSVGKQDDEIRSRIGVVFQDNLLDGMLTVRENLRIRGTFYGLSGKNLNEAVEKAAENTGATEFLDRRYGKLSGGQKRRADIARALMHSPEILFLDEPTTGLDPQTRQNIWETVHKMQTENNMTVFLTTHYMEEAAKADYVTVISEGQIVANGTPAQLRDVYARDMLYIQAKAESEQKICNYLNENKIEYTEQGSRIAVALEATVGSLPLLDAMRKEIESFEVIAGTMDDAFIAITKKGLRK